MPPRKVRRLARRRRAVRGRAANLEGYPDSRVLPSARFHLRHARSCLIDAANMQCGLGKSPMIHAAIAG
jgi:hypothetical protein